MTTTTASPADSDAAAFAAAEETYRAYVEALNAVDLADPSTFEPVYALTTGELRDETEARLLEMRDKGWRVEGYSDIRSISPTGWSSTGVDLSVCLDVHRVLVRDAAGAPVTSGDRSPVQKLTATVLLSEDGGLVEGVTAREEGPAC